jgi:hypothetical protein
MRPGFTPVVDRSVLLRDRFKQFLIKVNILYIQIEGNVNLADEDSLSGGNTGFERSIHIGRVVFEVGLEKGLLVPY